MSRVTTTNYAAVTDTQFAWATTGGDFFNREQDLYRLAQALEGHTHENARGLAVARIANNTVTTDNLQALSVTEAKINTGAVTNAKLGASSVGRDKMAWPLVQASNDMTGGFRQRETSNTYALGFYMAANGLAVFGAGTPSSIGTNLILGQTGQASVGTVQGGGKFNVIQTANGHGDGLRIYHSNQSDWWHLGAEASAYFVLGRQGTPYFHMNPATGHLALGNGASAADSRLHIRQSSDADTEGIRLTISGASGKIHAVTEGSLYFYGTNAQMRLSHSDSALTPVSNDGLHLGISGRRWNQLHVNSATIASATISGAVSMAGLTATTGTFSGNVSMSGLTATTGAFSGNVAVQGSFDTVGATILNEVRPRLGSGTGTLGTVGAVWQNLFVQNGNKPGGGLWTDASDKRTKIASSIRPYDRGLDTLLQINPVYYTQNGEYGSLKGGTFVGVIADDLEDIVPEMIGIQKRRRRKDTDPEEDVKIWDGSNLPYMAILAIKELNAKIEALERRLEDWIA